MPIAINPTTLTQTALGTERNKSLRPALLVGLAATVLVTLFYLSLFWNHFLGLRSGMGEFTGGSLFLAGLRPYKDYFASSMPFNTLKSAAELYLFGNLAIVSRACGVVERLMIASVLYLWLARMFQPRFAAVAAIVTMVVSSGDTSDPLASYNHDAIFFGMLSGFLASFVLDQSRSIRSLAIFAACSGIFAGLSFATKQTIGPGMTVAVPIVAAAYLAKIENVRRAAAFLGAFCLGWVLIVAALVLWLSQLGILNPFLHQVFVQGPAAKASHFSDFILRDIFLLRINKWKGLVALIGLALSVPLFLRSLKHFERLNDSLRSVLFVSIGAAACVGLAAFLEQAGVGRLSHRVLITAIYFTFFWLLLLTLFFVLRWLFRTATRREAQFCLFTAVSLASAFMLSLSYPIFEAMMLPGLGLLVAACLQAASAWRSLAVYAACAILLVNGTLTKLDIPFSFNSFSEPPVRMAHSVSSRPELKGFVLPEEIVKFVDQTLATIQTNTSANDTIFAYPEFGAFYALSGKNCPTFTCSHNIDVVNDAMARQEANQLLSKPPAVLIFQPQDEAFLNFEELLWRHGSRSGNRDLIDAVQDLAHRYRLAGEYTLPPDNYKVSVYVRPPNFVK